MKKSAFNCISSPARMLIQFLLMIVILTSLAAGAYAQDNTKVQISPSDTIFADVFYPIEGIVTNLTGNTMQLAGNITVDISQATFTSGSLDRATAANVHIGSRVTVYVKPGATPESQLHCANVGLLLEQEIVLLGIIQEIDAANRTITVLNQKIKFTEQTRFGIDGDFKTARTFEKLQVKNIVTITAKYEGSDLIAMIVVQPLRARLQHAQ